MFCAAGLVRLTDNGVGRKRASVLKELNKPRQKSYGISITEERIHLHNRRGFENDVIITDLEEGGYATGTQAIVKINCSTSQNKTMLQAVLIDDVECNLSALSEKLARYCPQIQIMARCDYAQDDIQIIERGHPDVVFLDIEMPVMNGFLMLQQLTFTSFALIFVTAYDHYAIKAIRYSALDYLVKPVDVDELKAAVSKAESDRENKSASSQIAMLLEQLHHKEPRRITIPTNNGLMFINMEDIIYLEASNNYTNIFLSSQQKILVCRTLKDFEELLPADTFLRIHHSNIINKFFVERYIRGEGGQVALRDGTLLDVSKRKKQNSYRL